jgi:23S rRNA (guanosine2251-2'-O)-methyltransferase
MKNDPRRESARRRPHQHTDHLAPVPQLDEEDAVALAGTVKDAFFLILDGVQDPHNLGACLRTANAAGVHAVVAPKDRAVALTETARHVACGAAEHTPFVQVTNLARFLKRLQEAGMWLVGTDDQADKNIYEIDLKGPLGIVMGAEGKGIRRLTAEGCDFLAKIPMAGQVDCLNVSVATGVCLFEAVRQRGRQA